MTRKVRKCMICGDYTIADNRLCKKPECQEKRRKERIHITHESGVFISLTRCTHGRMLNNPCIKCEEEWEQAQLEEAEGRLGNDE